QANELEKLREHAEDRRQRQNVVLPVKQILPLRPGEDEYRIQLILGAEGKRIARVVQVENVYRLGPEIAAAIGEHAPRLGPRQRPPSRYIGGVIKNGIMDGAKINVQPFLVVGFAWPFAGEVEVVEDLLAGVETVP